MIREAGAWQSASPRHAGSLHLSVRHEGRYIAQVQLPGGQLPLELLPLSRAEHLLCAARDLDAALELVDLGLDQLLADGHHNPLLDLVVSNGQRIPHSLERDLCQPAALASKSENGHQPGLHGGILCSDAAVRQHAGMLLHEGRKRREVPSQHDAEQLVHADVAGERFQLLHGRQVVDVTLEHVGALDEVCDRLRSDCLGAGQLRARAALKRLEVCHMEVERFPVGRRQHSSDFQVQSARIVLGQLPVCDEDRSLPLDDRNDLIEQAALPGKFQYLDKDGVAGAAVKRSIVQLHQRHQAGILVAVRRGGSGESGGSPEDCGHLRLRRQLRQHVADDKQAALQVFPRGLAENGLYIAQEQLKQLWKTRLRQETAAGGQEL
mmetsp:Transcript_45349/g.116071  ORF Transcript_45349/g.116071 Transcript_45349/m.116071 type:complete len:379 (+) Transcript_45349:70-1206(+)